MDELKTENWRNLAAISAGVAFPYIWLGLFLLLSMLFGANFFGQGFSGGLVSVILCLGLLNPLVPGALANYVARPVFLNLLGRELVTMPGCLAGLAGFFLTGLSVLFFLSRDLNISLLLFLAAPFVGGFLSALVTGIGRGNLISGLAERRSGPGPMIREQKNAPPRLLGGNRRSSQLPGNSSGEVRLPPARRNDILPPPASRMPPPPARNVPPPPKRRS